MVPSPFGFARAKKKKAPVADVIDTEIHNRHMKLLTKLIEDAPLETSDFSVYDFPVHDNCQGYSSDESDIENIDPFPDENEDRKPAAVSSIKFIALQRNVVGGLTSAMDIALSTTDNSTTIVKTSRSSSMKNNTSLPINDSNTTTGTAPKWILPHENHRCIMYVDSYVDFFGRSYPATKRTTDLHCNPMDHWVLGTVLEGPFYDEEDQTLLVVKVELNDITIHERVSIQKVRLLVPKNKFLPSDFPVINRTQEEPVGENDYDNLLYPMDFYGRFSNLHEEYSTHQEKSTTNMEQQQQQMWFCHLRPSQLGIGDQVQVNFQNGNKHVPDIPKNIGVTRGAWYRGRVLQYGNAGPMKVAYDDGGIEYGIPKPSNSLDSDSHVILLSRGWDNPYWLLNLNCTVRPYRHLPENDPNFDGKKTRSGMVITLGNEGYVTVQCTFRNQSEHVEIPFKEVARGVFLYARKDKKSGRKEYKWPEDTNGARTTATKSTKINASKRPLATDDDYCDKYASTGEISSVSHSTIASNNKKRQRVSNHVADKRSSKLKVKQCTTTAATAAKSITAIDTDCCMTMVEVIEIQPKVTADFYEENASYVDEMRTQADHPLRLLSIPSCTEKDDGSEPESAVLVYGGSTGVISAVTDLKKATSIKSNQKYAALDSYCLPRHWADDLDLRAIAVSNPNFDANESRIAFGFDSGQILFLLYDDFNKKVKEYQKHPFLVVTDDEPKGPKCWMKWGPIFQAPIHDIQFHPQCSDWMAIATTKGICMLQVRDQFSTCSEYYEYFQEETAKAHNNSGVRCVRFSPSGDIAASLGMDGFVCLWYVSLQASSDDPKPHRKWCLIHRDTTPCVEEALGANSWDRSCQPCFLSDSVLVLPGQSYLQFRHINKGIVNGEASWIVSEQVETIPKTNKNSLVTFTSVDHIKDANQKFLIATGRDNQIALWDIGLKSKSKVK